MISWFVEFEGRSKNLEEIQHPQLLEMIAPVKERIAGALAGDPNIEKLKVVFWVAPEEGLKFTLQGPSLAVNTAVDRLGQISEVSSRLN